jgi:putative transposase
MNDFTTELINSLAQKKDINEVFRFHVEKAVNTLLQTELSSYLGYERYDRQGVGTGNSRNGYYDRILDTEYGRLNLRIPRDRNGEFENQTLSPYKRYNDTLEETVILLYQNGMTTRDINEIIERMYGHHYSPQTVSNMTRIVEADLEAFNSRTFKNRYVAIYLDATHLPIRRNTVAKEAVYFAMGITLEGNKEILGYRVYPTESAHNWAILLEDLKSRGLEETLLFITDGLTGIRDAIHRVYPSADHQTCWVHMARNIVHMVRVKDRKEVLDDLRRIYTEKDKEHAEAALEAFVSTWGSVYPKVTGILEGNPSLLTFYAYPETIRKSIYTTNLMENFNKHLKRFTKRKEQFPNEESMMRFIVTQAERFNFRNASTVHRGFKAAEDALENMFEARASVKKTSQDL